MKRFVSAVFGGVKCNLACSEITDQSCLNLFCAFGGADLVVPKNVNVKINAFCLFGGISDKREVKQAVAGAPTLVINGFCLFGGADIKWEE